MNCELGQFIDWLNCECFPFEWRFTYSMQAISCLKKLPDVFRLLQTLHEWNENKPERLGASLQILLAILSRPSEQLRWQIQAKKIGPLLARGLNSDNPEMQTHAAECRDLLLKLGLFEFLEFTKG